MLQDLVVYALVALALLYLGRLWWKASQGRGGCGCGSTNGCARGQANSMPRAGGAQLVQIDLTGLRDRGPESRR